MKKSFLYIPFIMLFFAFFAQAKNYYDYLGVKKDASQKDITKAYRKLAMKLHPDRHPGKPEEYTKKFKNLGVVYGILSNKAKRKKYDYYLETKEKALSNWNNVKILKKYSNLCKEPQIYIV